MDRLKEPFFLSDEEKRPVSGSSLYLILGRIQGMVEVFPVFLFTPKIPAGLTVLPVTAMSVNEMGIT
jgi:hypothetical protein